MQQIIIILNDAFNMNPHAKLKNIYKNYPYANIHKMRKNDTKKIHLQKYQECAKIGEIIKCEDVYSFTIDKFLPKPIIYHIIAFNNKKEMTNGKFPNRKLIENILLTKFNMQIDDVQII